LAKKTLPVQRNNVFFNSYDSQVPHTASYQQAPFPETPNPSIFTPRAQLNRVYRACPMESVLVFYSIGVQFVYDSGAHFSGVPFEGVQPGLNPFLHLFNWGLNPFP
jgi:hypothetical protein